ncbi:hypothetical protein EVAR_2923_1 [Eumeta japonica]|uniref:Uncharacterized protein n=1 Tax=Eumeta variegata TaxID=151549 RepID=A0A4C1T3I1_EUMVA|nr:hypothetical protein EVAR_2923_1 [Eumeta japonica]
MEIAARRPRSPSAAPRPFQREIPSSWNSIRKKNLVKGTMASIGGSRNPIIGGAAAAFSMNIDGKICIYTATCSIDIYKYLYLTEIISIFFLRRCPNAETLSRHESRLRSEEGDYACAVTPIQPMPPRGELLN